MARKKGLGRNIVVTQGVTGAAGDTDADYSVLDMSVPGDSATLIDVTYTTKTAGVGTGTFTATLQEGLAGAGVNIAAAVTIDADAAAGVIHGTGLGTGQATLAMGSQIQIATVETGTVSTGAVLMVSCRWEL